MTAVVVTELPYLGFTQVKILFESRSPKKWDLSAVQLRFLIVLPVGVA